MWAEDGAQSANTRGGTLDPEMTIDLSSTLSLRNSFRFPIQDQVAQREVGIGALWLLVPIVGWLMNMGHRIMFVHRMHNGFPPFPAWSEPLELLKHGGITFLGMLYYYSPAIVLMGCAVWLDSIVLCGLSLPLAAIATIAIPGYMTFYCKELDPREIFDPRRALSRVVQGGRAYWHAWGIVLTLLMFSLLGLLGVGVMFLFTSVWFWQSAGFSFATVFTAPVFSAPVFTDSDELGHSP